MSAVCVMIVGGVGSIILIMFLVVSFLGYCLVYGNMSWWGIIVIFKVFSVIGVIGVYFRDLIFCGSIYIISELLVLHWLVGIVIAVLIFLHILVLHLYSSSLVFGNSMHSMNIYGGNKIVKRWYRGGVFEEKIKIGNVVMTGGEFFAKYFGCRDEFLWGAGSGLMVMNFYLELYKDIFIGISVLLVFAWCLVKWDVDFYGNFNNLDIADSLNTPKHIVPEIFFCVFEWWACRSFYY